MLTEMLTGPQPPMMSFRLELGGILLRVIPYTCLSLFLRVLFFSLVHILMSVCTIRWLTPTLTLIINAMCDKLY